MKAIPFTIRGREAAEGAWCVVWPGQGAAGKALTAQGFVVVVGRPRETFTENACRTGIRGNRILDGTGETY